MQKFKSASPICSCLIKILRTLSGKQFFFTKILPFCNKVKEKTTFVNLRTNSQICTRNVRICLYFASNFAKIIVDFRKHFWEKLKITIAKSTQNDHFRFYPNVEHVWSVPHCPVNTCVGGWVGVGGGGGCYDDLDGCWLGSSDFPRSLCFMWFWFGLEILRLVYKKAFFKILIGFYLIWAFNFQKKIKELNKNFFKIGHAGYQKKRNFVLISKMCRTLASRSSQRFFLIKTI